MLWLIYLNIRIIEAFLRTTILNRKSSKRIFLPFFSEKAGISAPSFLFYVISGKRNLTQSTILKISQAIGLSGEEADYFEALVFFNQATSIKEKLTIIVRLLR